jgi:hypothetical protein
MRVGRVLAGLLVAATVIVPAQRAEAHNVYYGFRNCTYERLQALQDVTVAVDSGARFPGDVIRDGVLNSFYNRLRDAVGRWDAALGGISGLAYGMRYQGIGDGNQYVTVFYEELGNNTTLGSTNYSWAGPNFGCTVHSTALAQLAQTWISIDLRNEWFTQDDSRRGYWENCADGTFTCSRIWDVGSIFVHELGHSLGLHHPEAVNSHTGNSTATSSSYGNCSSRIDDATMCALYKDRRTTWRTLHAWDLGTLVRHYQNT